METDPLLPRHNQNENVCVSTRNKFNFFGLFRYSTWKEMMLMLIGSLCAMIHGSSLPMLSVIFGQMTNTLLFQALATSPTHNLTSFVNNSSTIDTTTLNFSQYMTNYSLYYAYISIGVLIAAFIQTYCWELACERQVYKLRKNFFSQILRQDISWYDCNKGGDLTIKLSDDLERVREGIGSKCSIVIQYISTFITGIAVGLVVNMKLTLMVLIFGPLVIGASAYMAKLVATSSAREQEKYALAAQVAEQVLNNMRTVVAFGKQEQEIRRFDGALETGRLVAMKKYWMMAACVGVVYLINYLGYGFTFWYGSKLTAEGEATVGTLFTVFFSVMSGAFSLGNAMPFVAVISTAMGAASTLFGIIDRIPNIDSSSGYGQKPNSAQGEIEFRNVSFSYPAREDIRVLNNINLKIRAGQKVGIVGASGSGKSTIVSLLLRMYDPTSGQVLLNGNDLRNLNVQWLRSQIGVVSQEPVMFGTTIYENISYGVSKGMQDSAVIRAASDANAHLFISKLPEGYQTMIGGSIGGAQISGGEKQRIAIARALIRNPPLLILDEATSALDSSSEEVVQHALDKASEGRTTIIIAHRLSTVYKADCIYVLKDGVVVEQGNHSELIQQKGQYFHLVQAQTRDITNENRREKHSLITSDVNRNNIETKPNFKSSSLGGSIEDLASVLDEVLQPNIEKSPMIRLLKLNVPEWKSLALGLLFCACTGAIVPFFAIFYGEVFNTFTVPSADLLNRAEFWAIMFAVLAVWAGSTYSLEIIFMTVAAEHLVKRVRVLTFSNILRQPVSWLDQDDFSPSKLCTRLARDAPMVKSAAGLRAGQVVTALVTMVTALGIAFVFGWKLALMLTLGVPLLIFASYQLMLVTRRYQNRDALLMDKAGKVASESIQNIWTVQALGRENTFLSLYMENLEDPLQEAKKQALIFACIVGFCQAVIYAMYASAFRCGAYLVENKEMEVVNVFRVFFAMAFSAQSIGQTTAYLQDYSRARFAAEHIFKLMDHIPDMSDGTNKPEITGKISFNAVHFWYPSRPTVPVLRGLSLSVEKGRTLALVGASGSGKSTIIALLERFYEPVSGQIMIDGNDIKNIDSFHLRKHIGLVTQEPILFDCSLKDNIAYGSQETVSMDTIIEAAQAANIHDFITSLPQGYDTPAGNCIGQSQLSGGQKQRIAIARALVRNPSILLLDEATSALDATSEKEVQAALDKAREGRTCIIIAHRLSTIRNADLIAVVHKGQIVEQGSHDYLMSLKRRYYQLIKHQGL